MKISRKIAIKILKYLNENAEFYFPFLVVCKEYSDEDDDFVEIDPKEWRIINDDYKYQTFELWENLQNLDEKTLRLMAKGFLEEIIKSENIVLSKNNLDRKSKSVIFNITKTEIEEIFEEMIEGKIFPNKTKLNKNQINQIMDFVECDEMLAKDIRSSIRNSIVEVLEGEKMRCQESFIYKK